MKTLEQAYIQGWQDAADAVTSNFENALRAAIEAIEVPNFGGNNDDTQEPQG
jgi:hypothetical protein